MSTTTSCWVCGSSTTNTETGVCEECVKAPELPEPPVWSEDDETIHRQAGQINELHLELDKAKQAKAEAECNLSRVKEALGFATHIIQNFVNQLPSRRDWLDPELETMAKSFLAEQKGEAR